jgi:hypothetical protein
MKFLTQFIKKKNLNFTLKNIKNTTKTLNNLSIKIMKDFTCLKISPEIV